jgi:O-antigen/teichoic acid export membrane protein
MGAWSQLVILEGYLGIARLGILSAMNREYPFLLGKGDREAAAEVRSVAAAFVLTLGGAMTAFFGGMAVWKLLQGDADAAGWGAMAVMAPCALFQSYLEACIRGGQAFSRMLGLQVCSAIAALITLPLVAALGYHGFLMRAAGLAVLTVGLLVAMQPVPAVPRWNAKVFQSLLRQGLLLSIFNWLYTAGTSMPRQVLAWFGGEKLLGLFAPVNALINLGVVAAANIAVVFMPMQNEMLGRTADEALVARRALLGTAMAAIALVPPAVAASFLAPPAIAAWLPKYAAVGPQIGAAAPLILFGSLRIASTAYATLKRWQTLAWINSCFLATAFAIPVIWLTCDNQDAVRSTVKSLYIVNAIYAVLSIAPLLRLARAQPTWLR